jgi:uncharacterized repeat protein (TIGR01451 family)
MEASMRKLISLALTLGLLAAAGAALWLDAGAVGASPLFAVSETPTASSTPTRTATPSPTATRTPTATDTATAGPQIGDPLISKVANLQRASAGAAVQYTIVVSNANSSALNNVVVTDTLPATFDMLTATTTQGTFLFATDTRLLTFTLGPMQPGQVVTIIIQGRLNNQVQPPNPVRNVATVCDDANHCAHSASALTTIPGSLPVTGEGPGPNEILVMVLAGLVSLVLLAGLGLAGWRVWRRSTVRR